MKQLSTIQVVDVRHFLPVIRPHKMTGWLFPAKTGYTLHYAAVKTNHRNAKELTETLKGFRTNHIDRIGGDGIQYHFAIAADGAILQCRDLDQGLWSCANAEGNLRHIHINLPLAPGEQPTAAQWAAFERLVDALIGEFGWRGRGVGMAHREWPKFNERGVRVPNSACPGEVLMAKLDDFRASKPAPVVTPAITIGGPNGASFKVGAGFKDLYDRTGGLVTWGYPLGDEYTDTDLDGETCAYLDLEAATFKYKPSLPAPWNCRPILLSEAVKRALTKLS